MRQGKLEIETRGGSLHLRSYEPVKRGGQLHSARRHVRHPLTHALVIDDDALSKAASEKTGLDPYAPVAPADEPRVIAALGRAVMHNVRVFLDTYAKPARKTINVLVLDRMTRGDPKLGPLFPLLGTVGIAVSPRLLRNVSRDEPDNPLYDWIDASGEFTPTAIVGLGASTNACSTRSTALSRTRSATRWARPIRPRAPMASGT